MIENMKKLTVLLHARHKEQFLDSLRNVGVLHIVENPAAVSNGLADALEQHRSAQMVLTALRRVRTDSSAPAELAEAALSAEEIIGAFQEIERQREALNQSLALLAKQQALLEPWGDFDPDTIARLQDAGVTVRFFEATTKQMPALEKCEGAVIKVSQRGSRHYCVVLKRDGSIDADAEEVRLPPLSLSEIRESIAESARQMSSLEEQTARLARSAEVLERYCTRQKGARAYEAALLSMDGYAGGSVVSLVGWVPEKRCAEVVDMLKAQMAWYQMEDPETSDLVPILLRHNAFSRLFTPILKIFSLPDYFELDPTPFFAPFFMFFVGMCLGDVGYGAVLLAAALVAHGRVPAHLKGVMTLVIVLAACTTFNGLLLNSFFGASLFGGPGVPEGSSIFSRGISFAVLGPRQTDQGTVFPAMKFSLAIGVVQVLLGMVLSIINRVRVGGWTFGLQPLGYLFMVIGGLAWAADADFFSLGLANLMIGPVPVGRVLRFIPLGPAQSLVVGGLILHLFFNNPDQKVWVRLLDPTKGFLEFYFFVSGFVGNMLSYLRLFALGLSSSLLGSAFTYIAFMFIMENGKADYTSPAVVFTVLVLIVGHSLNLALSMIGSLVHPLRLTFVEFYTNLGFRGGGRPYEPFAHPQGDR